MDYPEPASAAVARTIYDGRRASGWIVVLPFL